MFKQNSHANLLVIKRPGADIKSTLTELAPNKGLTAVKVEGRIFDRHENGGAWVEDPNPNVSPEAKINSPAIVETKAYIGPNAEIGGGSIIGQGGVVQTGIKVPEGFTTGKVTVLKR